MRYALAALLLLVASTTIRGEEPEPPADNYELVQPDANAEQGAARPEASKADVTRQAADKPKACCKYCSKGKPCGNSCISRRYTCHQPPGCAC